MKEYVWMRVGDEDGYHEFDTVEDAAGYILEFYSLRTVTRGRKYGVESDDYSGNNYISLYWGDVDAEALRELTDDELSEFNDSLQLAGY